MSEERRSELIADQSYEASAKAECPPILCDISILRCTSASHLFHAVKVLRGPASFPLYARKQIGMKTRRTRFTDLNGKARLGNCDSHL
jgi:hypothetical protein